jgi:uncharacterized protein YjbJ (UPF0337 family)
LVFGPDVALKMLTQRTSKEGSKMAKATSQNITEKNWPEIRAQIKSKWSRLADDEVDVFRNDLDQIVPQIQKTYGMPKDRAEREYEEFCSTLERGHDEMSEAV